LECCAALDTRVSAINEGLNDPSRRFRAELVVSLAYGEVSRLPLLAADLVNEGVHAIVAVGPPAVQAAKDATANIPEIAIDLESDPVASGWIQSLARLGDLTDEVQQQMTGAREPRIGSRAHAETRQAYRGDHGRARPERCDDRRLGFV
jgi:hypothetical protein